MACKRHKWTYSDDCENCGAVEEYCIREDCHAHRMVDASGKELWREE